jgi:hypothetical protein
MRPQPLSDTIPVRASDRTVVWWRLSAGAYAWGSRGRPEADARWVADPLVWLHRPLRGGIWCNDAE